MLNSQPMGFYGPSQLVQDAQRHGVVVLPVDVQHSDWDCTLEGPDSASGAVQKRGPQPAVRLGLRLITGLSEAAAQRISQARAHHAFASTEDLALRAALDAGDLKALASADALHSLSGHRRQQVWDASALNRVPLLLREAPVNEMPLFLSAACEGEEVRFDYAALGLTLRSHPASILRQKLSKMKLLTAAQLRLLPNGRLVRACGLVTMRQSPGTAKGVTFVTLEDETGTVNVIVWKALKERQRSELLHSRLMAVHGTWQRDTESGGQVCHVVAGFLRDLTPLLGELTTQSREFH
jgi:error-prone DNA polymerase